MTTRVDPHIKILSDEVVDRAKNENIDILVYAPHFKDLNSIKEKCNKYTCEDVKIVPGREIFTGSWSNRNHVLAIGLSSPVPDFIPLKNAIFEIKRQDAALLVPHPTFLTVGLSENNISLYQEYIDSVEVYNPKYWKHHINISNKIVNKFNINAFCSSYAHINHSIGESFIEFQQDLNNISDLVKTIKGDQQPILYRKNGIDHKIISKAEFFHNLLYEDTWEKFDRVCLSGMEQTHPKQSHYDSRFEKMCVY